MLIQIWRPRTGRVRLKIPYFEGTRFWLREVCGAGTRPDFDRDRKDWTVSRNHLRAVVEALVDRFGEVELIVDQGTNLKCGPSCQNAISDECQCQCLGVNHGGLVAEGWLRVSEEFLVDTAVSVVRIRYRVTADAMEAVA